MVTKRSFGPSLILLAAVSLSAQPNPGPAAEKSEPGIPVRDELTKKRCGGCHRPDANGSLSRISWLRTTPEGWQQAIKRMVRLNGLTLTPAEAKHIVQYLATEHGLAPEEAAPVAWYYEKRAIDEANIPNDQIRQACTTCHPFAQGNSWRRSAKEWQALVDMHIGYFPVVEFTSFRRNGPPPGPDTPPDQRKTPVEAALEHWTKTNPLHTPEWARWQASMRKPRLQGRWLLWGQEPGKGVVLGDVTIEPAAADSEFSTRVVFTELSSGRRFERTGRTNLYAGYAWRGRSLSTAPDSLDNPKEMREVLSVSRDQSKIEGRWFWGAYQEFGINATLIRADQPVLLGAEAPGLKTGTTVTVKLHGDGLPANPAAAEISFGNGVTVKRIVSATPRLVTLEVEIAKEAVFGPRDAQVGRLIAPAAVFVYDRVDYIKVSSDTALARLGGFRYPKGYVQFEAVAYHRGLDGKPETADDIALGPVPVKWGMEEFLARMDDDDKDFVGTINATSGLFTPNIEGPNPKRKFTSDNFGDVWITAAYQTPDGKTLTAKSYLVVTIPPYMKWDQPEVAQ
jgi:quinohemoprotein amine dehydrogenase